MSGGSWDYLCHRERDLYFADPELLEAMAKRLDEEGSPLAAAATREFLKPLPEPSQALRDAWHAVEWCDSGDWGRDDLKPALAAAEAKLAAPPG